MALQEDGGLAFEMIMIVKRENLLFFTRSIDYRTFRSRSEKQTLFEHL
jgi:hypothetical protein